MDYTKHYDRLIEKARQRTELNCYSELHHIIPRCMGGGDEASNLVRLTAREHYVAHQLLVKMYPWHGGLISAVVCMTTGLNRQNNRCYGWVREAFGKVMSTYTGEKNSQYGTRWITNGVNSKKLAPSAEIPEGWRYGHSFSRDTGLKYVTNGLENKLIKPDEEIPKGWRIGRYDASTLGRKCITDGTSIKYIEDGEEIPAGYKLGNSLWSIKGKKRITDGRTVRYIDKDKQVPDGFELGANYHSTKGKKCVTNGAINKFICIHEELPEGFRYGMTRKKKP